MGGGRSPLALSLTSHIYLAGVCPSSPIAHLTTTPDNDLLKPKLWTLVGCLQVLGHSSSLHRRLHQRILAAAENQEIAGFSPVSNKNASKCAVPAASPPHATLCSSCRSLHLRGGYMEGTSKGWCEHMQYLDLVTQPLESLDARGCSED